MNEIWPVIRLAGISVGVNRRRLSPSDSAEVGFRHIGAQPDVIEVGQRDDRRAGLHHFAELGLAHQNNARERRAQGRVAEHYFGELEILLRVVNVGPRDCDVLLRATLHREVALHRGAGLLKRGVGVVALVAGNDFFIPELLTADVVDILLREVGVIVGDGCVRGLELLHRRLELLLLHLKGGFVDGDLLAVIAVVEPRQQRAGLYPLTLVERQLDDARLYGFEADDTFVGFDIAGNEQIVGRGLRP